VKIRTGFGDLDLAAYRSRLAGVSDEDCEAEAVLDALEAALSVGCDCNTVFEASYVGGYKTALDDVRQAAGVIEEAT
jgi:hypothetical protein